MKRATVAIVVCLAIFPPIRYCLDNGLARTPPMGYNTWNAFHEEIDEKMVRESAEILISSGLAAAGYNYFNLDGDPNACLSNFCSFILLQHTIECLDP